MTFVLGLTGERINARYLPKTHYKPAQVAVAKGSKVLNRHNCTGCHVLEMPKFVDPRGHQGRGGVHRLQGERPHLVQQPGRPTSSPSSIPNLTYDPEEAGPDDDRGAAGADPRRRHADPIEGMPTAVFENELTVQLWRPVTIRGYHVQRRRQRRRSTRPRVDQASPARAATSPGCRDDPGRADRRAVRDVLEPPAAAAAPRGEQGADPLAHGLPEGPVRDPAGGATADAAVPLRQANSEPGRETDEPGELLRGPRRRRVPLPGDRRAHPTYLADRSKAHPDYLGGRLGDDDQQGLAVPPVPRDRRLKPTGSGPRSSTGRTSARSRRGSGRDTWRNGSPTRAGWSPTRPCPRTSRPTAPIQMPVPKTFENQPMEMVRAIRDTLLNYVNAVELQLAGGGGPKTTATARVRARPSRRRARRP